MKGFGRGATASARFALGIGSLLLLVIVVVSAQAEEVIPPRSETSTSEIRKGSELSREPVKSNASRPVATTIKRAEQSAATPRPSSNPPTGKSPRPLPIISFDDDSKSDTKAPLPKKSAASSLEKASGTIKHAASSKPPQPSDVGIVPADGFEVVRFADDDLAHDVYCMTLDSLGRVVVSGPGYVRILIDSDGDGRADSFKQYADGPKTGAQGMFFHGHDLICTGDAGLLRFRDANFDDRADGPPDVMLKIKAGGEHHSHAVKKGPDGWWYVIAGNFTGVTNDYANLPTSPVKDVEAGVLLRLAPDLNGGEVFSHGMRNAYDFDFHPSGDVFTYDSDGERDISLPWYRPTRVFQLLPGSHAGWTGLGWKRADNAMDMPPVLASLGRASPTAVVCYQHTQFPAEYRGAIFAADWTFGRVTVLPTRREGSIWSAKPQTFLRGSGTFGFAPTAMAVAPDGSLFVSVGGRGTRGGVYRVRWKSPETISVKGTKPKVLNPSVAAQATKLEPEITPLTQCLRAPQPLSSWSRAFWQPVAKNLGKAAFEEAAVDTSRDVAERLRAIEILVEMFQGPGLETVKRLILSESAPLRARTAWAIGRAATASPSSALLAPLLSDIDGSVSRAACEALLGIDTGYDATLILTQLAARLGDNDRFVRQTAIRVAVRLGDRDFNALAEPVRKSGVGSVLAHSLARAWRSKQVDFRLLEIGTRILEGDYAASHKLEAVRIMQIALGDLNPDGKVYLVFSGYAPRRDLKPLAKELAPFAARLARCLPAGDPGVDEELLRLLAMIAPPDATLYERITRAWSSETNPTEDVHALIVLARLPVVPTAAQREAIARMFVQLDSKLLARGKKQDLNWDDRIREVYRTFCQRDHELPLAIVRQPGFGRPGHVLYLAELESKHLPEAVQGFMREIRKDAEYPWTSDVVVVLGESTDPAVRELIRGQFDNFSVRGAVVAILAKQPDVKDRARYLAGLELPQIEVLEASLTALSKLPPAKTADEQFALLELTRRLGADRREFPVRESAARLLAASTGIDAGYVHGLTGYVPQPKPIAVWEKFLATQYPQEAARRSGTPADQLAALRKRLDSVDWNAGNAERGKRLFVSRSCAQCHGSRSALGPDLIGVAARFSRDDLFLAIEFPSRDVSPRYQTTVIQTVKGKVYSGLIVYESVDGVLLRNGLNQTLRIEASEIEQKRKLKTSLMPNELLKGLQGADLADLYAYLRTLDPQASGDAEVPLRAGPKEKESKGLPLLKD